jgi:hypothetical protein
MCGYLTSRVSTKLLLVFAVLLPRAVIVLGCEAAKHLFGLTNTLHFALPLREPCAYYSTVVDTISLLRQPVPSSARSMSAVQLEVAAERDSAAGASSQASSSPPGPTSSTEVVREAHLGLGPSTSSMNTAQEAPSSQLPEVRMMESLSVQRLQPEGITGTGNTVQ